MIALTTSSVVALSIGATVALDVSRERAAAPQVEIVDEMAALVNAMTDVVGVVRTRLLPALQPSSDGAAKAA